MVNDATVAGASLLLAAGLLLQAEATASFRELDGISKAVQFLEWGTILIALGIGASLIAWAYRNFHQERWKWLHAMRA